MFTEIKVFHETILFYMFNLLYSRMEAFVVFHELQKLLCYLPRINTHTFYVIVLKSIMLIKKFTHSSEIITKYVKNITGKG